MIKVLIFSGTHPRHFFINSIFLNYKKKIKSKYIFMDREKMIPKTPRNLSHIDKKNFSKHFKERDQIEKKQFGKYENLISNINKKDFIKISSKELNSDKILSYIKNFKADFIFIFGVDLISKKILKVVRNKNLNLHLGLSPWYRGSATFFWPFYFLQPNYVGATFHEVNEKIDDGKIFHQTLPRLKKGQKIHDVAVNCVKKSKMDLKKIITEFLLKKRKLKKYLKNPKHTGKIFFEKSFKPQHLRVIYNLYNNNIVNLFLENKISKNKPKIIKQF